EVARVDADAALATARIDAAIPRELIPGLDYDKYQGELDHATREVELKRREEANAKAAVERRRRDAALEIEKLELEREYLQARVASAEIRADRDGVLLHGFNNNWLGGRIDEGSATIPGSTARQVVSDSRVEVVAWALEPDRRALEVGQPVSLAFDAFSGQALDGKIVEIAGAPAEKREWGEGRYFSVRVELDRQDALPLLPGMSVRVATGGLPAGKPAPATVAAQRPLRIDGEVYARRTVSLAPPPIDRQWTFNITQLAPDGAPVEKGDVVVSFDSSQVA